MILKNLALCVVRAYFEISISLKVHEKVYSGIAGWKRIWNVLNPANSLQKNWRGVDIHNWPANTNRTIFYAIFNREFPAKIFISSDRNEQSNRFILRFNASSNDYKTSKFGIRIATNDVFIACCTTEKVIFFSISTTIFQVVQANMRISSKSFLRHTYIGKHYNISA